MAIGLAHDEAPARPVEPESPRSRRRRIVVPVVVAIVLLIAAVVGWIGIRASLARQQLEGALPAAKIVVDDLRGHDLPAAKAAADRLKKHAAEAVSLTGDPVWRFGELVPWIGPNLAAVRTVAAATDSVAGEVIRPLISVAGRADPRSMSLSNGRVDLAPLVAARPVIARAQAAFHHAQARVAGIQTGALVAPASSAVTRLDRMFAQASPTVDAIADTAKLLPDVLGQSGARNYLMVAQNPAELRATGGLIGSVALIHADRGAISLAAQEAGTSIGPWPSSVATIPAATQGLYGPLVGRYLQDANYTPDFPMAARTVATMWERTHGGTVDGVITVDPVVLSALLKATGPLMLLSGDMLTQENAVPLLLSEVYSRFPEGAPQDAFFASAASAIFQRLAAGGVDGSTLLTAFSAAGSSDRLRMWSVHAAEQKVLASTPLAGELPVSTSRTGALGVYFNDGTGAKMDYYLGASVSAGGAVCRADGTPTSLVTVTLTSRAPADAATALPRYVTGGGHYGVPAGQILTRIAFYGPSGGLLAGVSSGTSGTGTVSGSDRGRPVAVVDVLLAPGESKTVTAQFLGVKQSSPAITTAVTPVLPAPGVAPDVGAPTPVGRIADVCGSAVK